MKQTLFTETNIKLGMILLCLVFLAQSVTDAFTKMSPDGTQTEVVVEQTWTINEDPELHTCAHGDGEIYRGVHWHCNSNWLAQDIPDLQESWRLERMRELLRAYDKEYLYDAFFWAGKMTGIYPELWVCIAKADTTLGRHTKSANNIWNVWNNDRWQVVNFDSEYEAVLAIFQTLNNRYLWSYNSLGQLTRKYNKDWYVYASSEDNHFNNTANCLSVIRWENIDKDWVYRF